MKLNLSSTLRALSLGALMMVSGLTLAATPLPPIQHSGSVDYLSGGIGQDESRAIESASKEWPLTMEFAIKDKQRADFAADVSLAVRDAQHHPMLQLKSVGPFVLAKLKPGKYTVAATLAGKTLQQQVLLTSGKPTSMHFLWPTGTGETRS